MPVKLTGHGSKTDRARLEEVVETLDLVPLVVNIISAKTVGLRQIVSLGLFF